MAALQPPYPPLAAACLAPRVLAVSSARLQRGKNSVSVR